MKIVSDCYKNLKNKEFYQNQFKNGFDAKNILFVDPVMNTFDFYSMIVPYFALAESDLINTALTGMYKYSEIDSKPITKIQESQIKWADVIVFPISLEEFGGENNLFSEIKLINPNVKIIQTVPFDFYELQKDHYLLDTNQIKSDLSEINGFSDQLTKTQILEKIAELRNSMINRFELNLKYADKLIVLNFKLKKKLESKGFLNVEYLPILISKDDFVENIDYKETIGIRGSNDMVYLSCELNENTKTAFEKFIPILISIKKKHEKKFQLIIIGDHPMRHFSKFSIDFTHIEKGSIIHHFKTIVKSSADIHLSLNKLNQFSENSDILFDYVDRGLFGIPIISLNTYPQNEIILNGENGFLIKKRNELIKIVDNLINNKSSLVKISENLKNSIIKDFQLTDERIEELQEIFFN